MVLRKIYKTKMLVKKIREKKLVNFLGVLLPSPLSIVRKGRLISLASFYAFWGVMTIVMNEKEEEKSTFLSCGIPPHYVLCPLLTVPHLA